MCRLNLSQGNVQHYLQFGHHLNRFWMMLYTIIWNFQYFHLVLLISNFYVFGVLHILVPMGLGHLFGCRLEMHCVDNDLFGYSFCWCIFQIVWFAIRFLLRFGLLIPFFNGFRLSTRSTCARATLNRLSRASLFPRKVYNVMVPWTCM